MHHQTSPTTDAGSAEAHASHAHPWSRTVLAISAVLLAGLLATLLVVPSRASSATAAEASLADVTRVGDYTMITADGGNEDIVLVLDNRNEELLAYKVRNQTTVELLQKTSLPELFERGRAGTTRGR